MGLAISVSEEIRQIRLQKGLSQENMAEMLGLSTTAYGDIERGRTELSVSRLETIAKVLDIPLMQLLGTEAPTLSEIDWLRQENARLAELNLKLQLEVEQWKSQFKVWFGDAVTQGVAEQRQRIGFK